MTWTAEELVILKQCADEGLSSGKIAAFLPNKSRNAVIGMLKRGDGAYGRLQAKPKSRAKGRATPKSDVPVKRPYRRKAAVAPPIVPPPIVAPVEVLFTSPSCDGHTVPANLPATRPRTFLDAMLAGRCLHYVGDPFGPDGPDMPVCGAERAQNVIETRYCRRHLIGERQPRAVA